MNAQTVVVPIDFSDSTPHALQAALDAAGGDASKVRAVHILYPIDATSPGVIWGVVDDDQRIANVEESFAELRSKHGLPEVSLEVRVGDPGLSISDFADEVSADLIVIPSHGFSGLKRLVLGSVAERVIRHAHCSVLVLRRNDAE